MTEEKRNKKFSTRPLRKFNSFCAITKAIGNRTTSKSGLYFIHRILNDFFFLQWRQAMHFTHRPVVRVDTELDDKIPFTPSEVDIYLSFINIMTCPLDFMLRRMDSKIYAKEAKNYLDILAKIYSSSADIYKTCMTTTKRPKYYKGKFFTIHFFDPHLLCVPSIHVEICAAVYVWFTRVINESNLSSEEKEMRLKEIKDWSFGIIESVLFVKQHSINCIPAALYTLTVQQQEGFFTKENADDIISKIFKESSLVSDENKVALTSHFDAMYERFTSEYKSSEDWKEPVINWIKEYSAKTGQSYR